MTEVGALLLVIYGAGASFDSCADVDISTKADRIPMADDLFDTQYAPYVRGRAPMRAVLPWLRHRQDGKNVEQVLEQLRGQAAEYPTRLRQLMAIRLYLAAMIRDVEDNWVKRTDAVSNYRTMVDELNRLLPSEPIAFVTFNYDRMLERALESDTPRRLKRVTDFASPNERINVFKLHGSVSWFRQVELRGAPFKGMDPQQGVLERAQDVEFLDSWAMDEQLPGMPNRTSFVPALAVPLESKQDYECPPSHIVELTRLLPQVSHIVDRMASNGPPIPRPPRNACTSSTAH